MALNKARNDEALELADVVDTAWSKRQADAFVTILREYLGGSSGTDKALSDN